MGWKVVKCGAGEEVVVVKGGAGLETGRRAATASPVQPVHHHPVTSTSTTTLSPAPAPPPCHQHLDLRSFAFSWRFGLAFGLSLSPHLGLGSIWEALGNFERGREPPVHHLDLALELEEDWL